MTCPLPAPVPALALALVLAASIPVAAEDTASGFDAGWDEPIYTYSIDSSAYAPISEDAAAAARAARDGDPLPSFQWGSGELRFDEVEGAPGARIKPRDGAVSLGVGIQPVLQEAEDPLAPFGRTERDNEITGIGEGFTGAFELSETRGSITQSMSISGPIGESGIPDPTGRAANDEVRTMFGLGYNF